MENVCNKNAYKKKLIVIVGIILFLIAEVVLTKIGFNDAHPWVNVLLFVGIIVVAIKWVGIEYKETIAIRNLLLIGCVARLVLMFLMIYKDGIIDFPYVGDEHLYFEALDIYTGVASLLDRTWYKLFIYMILCIFGGARESIHFINILAYVGSFLLLVKLFDKYEIRYKLKLLGLFVFSFFPVYLLVSSSHMREGLMVFAGIVALYAFDKVVNEKKYLYISIIFVASLICAIFHSGAFVILVPFIIWIFFFEKEKNSFVMTGRKLLVLGIIITLALFAILSPFGKLVLSYLPSDMDGFIGNIEWRMYKAGLEGRANYLMDIEVNSMRDVFLWWPIKMVYFQFSPLFGDWTKIKDVIGFLTDSIFYIVASGLFVRLIICRRYRWHGLFFLMQMLCFQFVFAWGVMNAGAAIRHRSKIFGILLVGVVYAIEMLLRERKGTKNVSS